jgi:hypothetical protein
MDAWKAGHKIINPLEDVEKPLRIQLSNSIYEGIFYI